MPYIAQNQRQGAEICPETVGELTYVLTKACLSYLFTNHIHDKLRFKDFAEVLAALEATKLEFYRRAVSNFEDTKIKEHGDVGYDRLFDRKLEEPKDSADSKLVTGTTTEQASVSQS